MRKNLKVIDPNKLKEAIAIPYKVWRSTQKEIEDPIIHKMVTIRQNQSMGDDLAALHDELMVTVFGDDFKETKRPPLPTPIFVRPYRILRGHNYKLEEPCLMIWVDEKKSAFRALQNGRVGNWLRPDEFHVIPENEVDEEFIKAFIKRGFQMKNIENDFRAFLKTIVTQETLETCLKEGI